MKLVFTVFWLILASQAFSQNIVGFWQASDTTISSNYQQHYVFSADKKFTYTPSGYDGLQRVLKIGGHYKLLGNTLYLTPEYTTELKGGVLERSHITTLNDSWSIASGQAKTYKIVEPIR
ncbi:lipocalin-like domain-containing protein [Hymenobacter baengnokdamensis]|uniref:lipocalin family protein n=1 Tax=Hymenobacter baengnokdamensis TaxID=2615203 RepID=UPI001248BDA4|nr:lipocalin family protein [Hymenobacter baengnokdamensis]